MSRTVTTIVWVHAAAVVVHGAAHAGAGVQLSTAASAFVMAVIVAGPLIGLWMASRGRRVAGMAVIAGCMTGALVFGVWNHFVVSGHDHVNEVPAGVWQTPFRVSAWVIAVLEGWGAIAAGRRIY